MLPDHVILEKAGDAIHAKNPNLTLDELEKAMQERAAQFKAKCSPPAPPAK
jgi:hypothetical protein